jgi:hypothetical protein
MHTAAVILMILAAAANTYAAFSDITRPAWILENMKKLGIPESWLPTLGVLKGLGALGLLAGIAIPFIGIAAAAGLILFFLGAVVAVVRARWYPHMPYPLIWLALAVAALVLQLRSA